MTRSNAGGSIASAAPSSVSGWQADGAQIARRGVTVLGFCGSTHRGSHSRALVEAVLGCVAARRSSDAIATEIFDIVDVMPELGQTTGHAALPEPVERVIARLEKADALVVGTPVYKGSYTGLFKHFFDLVEPRRLLGMPVILTACGGGDRHALVVEHQLRPLFGFFSAHTIATSIYASDGDFADGLVRSELLQRRIEAAIDDLEMWLERPPPTRKVAA